MQTHQADHAARISADDPQLQQIAAQAVARAQQARAAAQELSEDEAAQVGGALAIGTVSTFRDYLTPYVVRGMFPIPRDPIGRI